MRQQEAERASGLRRALAAALEDGGSAAEASLRQITALAPEDVARRLTAEGVLEAWLAVVPGGLGALPPAHAATLATARRAAAARHLLARHAAAEVGRALEKAGVPHVFFKGLHLAAWCYRDPTLRPMDDVDLFVPLALRAEVLAVLGRLGFTGRALPGTVSHEVPLRRGEVVLDLHWRLARPGRIPAAFEGAVLAGRERRAGLSVPSDVDAAALALAHPALTEHVTGRLLRVLDAKAVLGTLDASGRRSLEERLRRFGLSTPAWALLAWARRYTRDAAVAEMEARLRPTGLRARYLEAWLDADPEDRYWRAPVTVGLAFSLALSDRAGTALRALVGRALAARRAHAEAAEVDRILSRFSRNQA